MFRRINARIGVIRCGIGANAEAKLFETTRRKAGENLRGVAFRGIGEAEPGAIGQLGGVVGWLKRRLGKDVGKTRDGNFLSGVSR